MADYCIEGYLNTFVTPSPEGWGLDVTILSWIDTNKKMTHLEVYQAIQDSDLDVVVKALEADDIRKIMDWMVAQGQIGKPENQTITYTP